MLGVVFPLGIIITLGSYISISEPILNTAFLPPVEVKAALPSAVLACFQVPDLFS